MATVIDIGGLWGGGRAPAEAPENDRLKAFQTARRHTRLVRALKAVLPILAVLCLAVYGSFVFVFVGHMPKNFDPGTMRLDSEHVTMENPKYDGFGSDGTRYQFRAKTAVTDFKMSGPIRLNDIEGDLVEQTGAVTKIAADWGSFDQKKNELTLYERIDIDGSNGTKARLTSATIFAKDSRVVSSDPVVAETPTASIRARSMELNAKTRQVAFKGAVDVRMKPDPATPLSPQPQTAGIKGPAVPILALNTDAPVDIRADALDIDDNAKTALFRRNVIARQAGSTLQAPELEVVYEGRAALPVGAKESPEAATRLKLLRARGGVVMTQKEDRASSDAFDYDAPMQRATLRGDVVLTSGSERRVTSSLAEFDQLADAALLTGDVVVIQGQNVLKGQRLSVDRKNATSRLDSPAAAGAAAGRISATFVRPEPKAGKAVPGGQGETARPTAVATGSVPLGTAFKTDPKAPIHIDAQTLDVLDEQKVAVFKGGVLAKQGSFAVRSVELSAHYTGQSGLGLAAPAPGGPDRGARLTKIEARRSVVISSADGRTATGDWADFNVEANTAVVGGKVIVSQGDNVVEGTRLVIDMNTGQSRFETAGNASGEATSETSRACPQGQTCSRGRIRAVFYPNDVEAAGKRKAGRGSAEKSDAPSPKGPASSSWQATTQRPGAQ